MAIIGRNYPSVSGDSISLFVLGAVGMGWVFVDIILSAGSYSAATTMVLYIYSYLFMLLVMILAFISIVFERAFYLHYSKHEVVSKFLGVDLDFYEANVHGRKVKDVDATSWGPETEQTAVAVEVKPAQAPIQKRLSWPTLKAMVDGESVPPSETEQDDEIQIARAQSHTGTVNSLSSS
mmetsp:Transcript_21416/g.46696  ORF Transcript_21416/g.46696 Transcript_21416/m.46696 type:complete len:179 (-) Transcript_21416:503-1039(-)